LPRPEKVPNQRRGRPLGSAPYREADEKLLARYADKAIHNTGLELAPFARAAGVSQPATIRRLQARWRGDRERFLKDAQNRFDARRPEVKARNSSQVISPLAPTALSTMPLA